MCKVAYGFSTGIPLNIYGNDPNFKHNQSQNVMPQRRLGLTKQGVSKLKQHYINTPYFMVAILCLVKCPPAKF